MRSVFLMLLCGCSSPRSQPAAVNLKHPGKSLVFISFDALQASRVGPEKTPTLDALASRGFSFTHATSVASWTVPASMTWFTGVMPSEHRIVNKFALFTRDAEERANLKKLSPDLVTLAEVLRARGYATAGFTGNAGVSGGFGYQEGFATYWHENNRFGGFDSSIPRALEWLRANKAKPYFLFLHGYDAHGQFMPPTRLDRRWVDKEYDGRYSGSTAEQEALREKGLSKGRLSLREEDWRFWRAIYDGKVRRGDERVMWFLRELREMGEEPLIVVTSDHGTELGEHGRFDHGFTLYEEQVRVPLVFKLPGQEVGGRIETRVSSLDVMPTILDLLDVPQPKQVRGKSLVPWMRGEGEAGDVLMETDYREYTYKRGLVSADEWKLVLTMETGTRELYDLGSDPGETRDLSSNEKARADAMEARLRRRFAEMGHGLGKRRWKRGLNPVYDSQRPKE